ncbi:AMP-dependent CoA ligase/synthetase [Desulfatibacillum aliphaticivorans]|uniref:AMP-dependent CoA ligase/synthetase n=1 Tax=Desulfatibacillum aliphaticivorans TaxID=218208 RepID=B8FGF1_DESAL|nr:class I adenylate-forming enzyme family protein [Desulfatibacillum aliphaticivorans]ACL04860.1 AMP-dependent CoA ligase/synthetase [Desulfatibacillum aliphaticivorans]
MSEIIQASTVGEALETAASKRPGSPMFYYEDKEYSYASVNETTDRVAMALLNMGFVRGDKIGIIGLNQPEWLYMYFGAVKIGVVITGLSVRYRDTELEYILNQSETRAVLTLASLGEMNYVSFFEGFKPRIPNVKEFIFMGGPGFKGSFSFEDMLQTEIDKTRLDQAKAAVEPDDSIMIIYTSGTTGVPKGAVLSHKSQMASARGQAVHTSTCPDDNVALALPFNHVGGVTCGVLTSLLGMGKYILIPMFSPDHIAAQIKKYGFTTASGVPTMHALVLMNEAYQALDLSQCRMAIVGGSNADDTLLKKIYDSYPNARVMNLYGLSETSGAVVLSPWDGDFETTLKSIGKPIADFEVKVVDESGKEVALGETGELCFKGDAVTKGYYNMPEKTAETFRDGWLHTGDMGYLDEEGFIYLRGRKKEMYIQGGFNVYPVEVENLIARHPKVAMVAGIGVPDEYLGEVGRYYIVPYPDANPTEEEIKAFCKEHLADYKVPREIVFRAELPLTPAGKIQKSKLEEEAKEGK